LKKRMIGFAKRLETIRIGRTVFREFLDSF
jgi:hypothetical protein